MNQNKIILKDNWNEVSLDHFNQIKGILADENLMDIEKKVKVICLLSGKEESFFNSYTIEELNDVYNVLTFLNEKPEGKLKEYYTIGERTYKRVSNLTKLDFGQFVDLNEDLKDKEAIETKLHIIASKLLLPCKPLSSLSKLINKIRSIIAKVKVGKAILKKIRWTEILPVPESYLQTPIEETASNIYNNAMIVDIMGLSVFFYLLGGILGEVTLHFLESMKNEQLKSALMMLNQEAENSPQMKSIQKKLEGLKASERRILG